MLEICQKLIFNEMVLNCYEDNTAVLAIIARHLSKFHGINVASTCLAFNEPGINAEYIETLQQRADVLTKALSVAAWDSAPKLLQMVSAQDLKLSTPKERHEISRGPSPT